MGKKQDAAPAAAAEVKKVEDATVETDFGVLSADDLSNLTDEERAAISGDGDMEDEEESPEEADAEEGDEEAEAEEAEGDDKEGDDAEETDESDEDEAEEGDEDGADKEEAGEGDEAEGEEEGEGEEKAEADTDAEVADDEVAEYAAMMPAVPAYQVPENAEQQRKELQEKADALATQFDEGEIGAKEFHSQYRAVNDDLTKLNRQIDRAVDAYEQRHAGFTQKVVPAFLREHAFYKNEIALRALDSEVRRLQEANANPFDPKILVQAHKNISKAFNVPDAAETDAKPGKKAQKLPGKKGAKTPKELGAKKPKTPPTLARVPADEIDDQSGGKYARLDRLQNANPAAFEEALMKMTPAQRAEYERA